MLLNLEWLFHFFLLAYSSPSTPPPVSHIRGLLFPLVMSLASRYLQQCPVTLLMPLHLSTMQRQISFCAHQIISTFMSSNSFSLLHPRSLKPYLISLNLLVKAGIKRSETVLLLFPWQKTVRLSIRSSAFAIHVPWQPTLTWKCCKMPWTFLIQSKSILLIPSRRKLARWLWTQRSLKWSLCDASQSPIEEAWVRRPCSLQSTHWRSCSSHCGSKRSTYSAQANCSPYSPTIRNVERLCMCWGLIAHRSQLITQAWMLVTGYLHSHVIVGLRVHPNMLYSMSICCSGGKSLWRRHSLNFKTSHAKKQCKLLQRGQCRLWRQKVVMAAPQRSPKGYMTS